MNWRKNWPPSTSLKSTVHRCNSAATQICCNYPWSPKGRKNIHRGDQRKIFEKKNGKIFFKETFLMKKSKDIWCIPFRKIKCKKLCAKKFSTQQIVENQQFWFFGRFSAFWAPKWPKIGPKIGPNIKFEFWIPQGVSRSG